VVAQFPEVMSSGGEFGYHCADHIFVLAKSIFAFRVVNQIHEFSAGEFFRLEGVCRVLCHLFLPRHLPTAGFPHGAAHARVASFPRRCLLLVF